MLEPVSAISLQLGLAALYSLSRPASAVSFEAGTVRATAGRIVDSVERSGALFGSKTAAISQVVWGLASEHGSPGWDGGDALPVDRRAIDRAVAFIKALPDGMPMPEVAADPDGSVSLDWIRSRHCLFTLSIGAENKRLAYAWIDGNDRGHAVSTFEAGAVPQRVLDGILSVTGHRDAAVRAA